MNSSINIYPKLCLMSALLIAVLNISNVVYSADKPLGTIGEPQINSSKNISSPFGGLAPKENTTSMPQFTSPTPNMTPAPVENTQQPAATTVKANNNAKATPQGQAKQEENFVGDPKNPLGLGYPYAELEKSKELLKKKETDKAKAIVEPLSKWLTDLTEYHIQLFKKLSTIESAKNQAQVEKQIALDAALLRDKAYYQLALVYLSENKDKDAIKYFVEVIKSQPKTELGMKAYEILQQVGFTEKVRLAP
jgi:hypothetical protein